LWCTDLFLGSDSETNKATDDGRQQVLNKRRVGYNNGGTVGNGVLYCVCAKELYNEDNS
jgi:hypothetical protein